MNDFVFIKSGKSIIKINVNDIVAIQGLGNYVQIHTSSNAKYTHYSTLDSLLDQLPDYFMRVHVSYIVNFNSIDKLENNHVFLNRLKIPVGPSKKECLKKRIEQHML